MLPTELTRLISEQGYTVGVSSDGGLNLLAVITEEIAKKNPKIAHKKGQLEQVGRGIPIRTYNQLKSVSATNREWAQRLIEYALGHASALQSGYEMRIAALESEIAKLKDRGDSNPVILPGATEPTILPDFDVEVDTGQQAEQDALDEALTEQDKELDAKSAAVEAELMKAEAELEDAEGENAEEEVAPPTETVPPDAGEWEEIGDKKEG